MSREAGTQEQSGQRRATRRSRSEKGSTPAFPGRRASAKSLLPFSGDEPPSVAIDKNSGEAASYYIGNHHQLIHRHTESMAINADQTARWTLKIDFELPEASAARCGEHNGETFFLFPLLFLRKAQGRTGFEARDERGAIVPLLNREESDTISARAAARAAAQLIQGAQAEKPDLPDLPPASLQFVFERICRWRPYVASVILNKLKQELKELDNGVLEVWEEAGLIEDLELLVDHSLVWVPLKGLPGESRVIEVGHDTELSRLPLLRWHFGELKVPGNRLRWWRRWRRTKQREDPKQVLDTGREKDTDLEMKYGRTARRLSLSVLGERLAQPLGWMPIEFDFPTIYTRRCGSYHFEMTCPGGLKPRGVRIALDREGEQEEEETTPGGSRKECSEDRRKRLEETARTTMGNRAAHVYLPGGRYLGDLVLRATVGISSDAYPILWVLMGILTTMMLWSLVAFNPNELVVGDSKNHNEIAAGVLLIVPALLGALIVGADDRAESKLLGGARILLLVTGLCCAGATAVLIKIEPFSAKPQATWAVCAAIATAAMIPLVTGWLLSLDAVWRGREALNTVASQYVALVVLGGLAFVLVALVLPGVGGDTAFRAGLASCLLLLAVMLILLASNRLPVALEANRKFVSVGAMILAAACVLLGCVELQRIFAPDARWQIDVESVERWIFLLAPSSGVLLWLVTRIFGPRREELSISPSVGQALIAEERIRELRRLREIDARPDLNWSRIFEGVKNLKPTFDDDKAEERYRSPGKVKVEPAGRTEGDWSAAVPSSTALPEYVEGEFKHLVKPGVGQAFVGEISTEELERREIEEIAEREAVTPLEVELALLREHVDSLLTAAGKDGRTRRFMRRLKPRRTGR